MVGLSQDASFLTRDIGGFCDEGDAAIEDGISTLTELQL